MYVVIRHFSTYLYWSGLFVRCTDGIVRPAAKRLCEVQIPISGTASDRHGNARNCRSNPETIVCILLVPSTFAAVISGIIIGFVGGKFNLYAGTTTPVVVYFGISLVLFLGVYSVYFVVTYVGFFAQC